MSFRQYLEGRYATACAMQRGIHRDPLMVAMLQEGQQDAALVQTWMREYGLFQGITAPNRNAVVNRFIEFAAEHQRHSLEPNADEIQALYVELLGALHGEVARSWVSATSKLLWCLYPNTIVIYDAFVHRALAVMQCIDGDLEGFPRVGEPPRINGVADIAIAAQHYMNYQAMVRRLLSVHAQLLRDLRARHNEQYPYDVRIMDKVLWMIGNVREAYPRHA